MGIFLVGYQRGGIVDHRLGGVAMQVQFGANYHLRPDQGADMGQQVAFAIVIAIGHHGAMQVQQHHVHRHRGPQPGHQFVSQGLIDLAHRGAGRLRRGRQALDHLMPLGFCQLAPFMQRAGEEMRQVAGGIAPECPLGEGGFAGWQRREGVGLGGQAGDEDAERLRHDQGELLLPSA